MLRQFPRFYCLNYVSLGAFEVLLLCLAICARETVLERVRTWPLRCYHQRKYHVCLVAHFETYSLHVQVWMKHASLALLF